MREALFFAGLHSLGWIGLLPLRRGIPAAHLALCALPTGMVIWLIAGAVCLALGASTLAMAVLALVIAVGLAAMPPGRDLQFAGSDVRRLVAGATITAVSAFVLAHVGFVVVSYDGVTQLVLGQGLLRDGLTPEVGAQLASWGIWVPFMHGSARLAKLEYFQSLQPLLAVHLFGIQASTIWLAIAKEGRHWAFVIALSSTLFLATTYFIVFQAALVHNSLVSALYLLIAVHALWEGTRSRSIAWFRLALPALLGFTLSRTEAPVFAAMALVLTFAADQLHSKHATAAACDPMRSAWRILVLPYAVITVAWYVLLTVQIGGGSDILSPPKTFALISVVLAAAVVLAMRTVRPVRALLGWSPLLLVAGSALSMAAGAAIAPELMFTNLDAIFKNLAWAGRWGTTWIALGLVLLLAAGLPRFRGESVFVCFAVGFVAIVLVLGLFRVPYRLGWGDSANRMFTHLLPVLILYVAIKVRWTAPPASALRVSRATSVFIAAAFAGLLGLAWMSRPLDLAIGARVTGDVGFCPADHGGDHSFAVTLRGVTDEQYAAACSSGEREIVIDLGRRRTAKKLEWVYYAPSEYFTDFAWSVSADGSSWRTLYDSADPASARPAEPDLTVRSIPLTGVEPFRYVRLNYRASAGQNRLLLKRVKLQG